MKKINIPEYYPRYYTASDHPEIIDAENANFISILAKGSFTEKIFYQRIALLKFLKRSTCLRSPKLICLWQMGGSRFCHIRNGFNFVFSRI
jgi:hypothetical protein